MRSSITRLIIAVAVVGVIPVGSVVAQSPVEEALPNRYEAPHGNVPTDVEISGAALLALSR